MDFQWEYPEALEPYLQQVDAAGKWIVEEWAYPALKNREEDPESWSWPLAKFRDAIALDVGYLLFVLIGYILFGRGATQETKAPQNQSVAQKFAKEPILILIAIYNAAQVALCGYMIREAVLVYQAEEYSPLCNDFDIKRTTMARVVWIFYLSKVLDFMDTFFIVVRRKWRQLSFLHLYHHSSIFLVYWLNVNAGFDGDVYYTVVLNGAIHFIMYFYYLCRSFNIAVPMVLKQFVTNSQILQFITMVFQAVYILSRPECPYPRNIVMFYFGYILTLLVLFLNFHRQTYGTKSSASKKKKTK